MEAHPEFLAAEVSRIFESIDIDHQGELSYNKFIAATLGASKDGIEEQSLRKVFALLDADGDEIVTFADLQAC